MTSSLWSELHSKTKNESPLYLYYFKAHTGIKKSSWCCWS